MAKDDFEMQAEA